MQAPTSSAAALRNAFGDIPRVVNRNTPLIIAGEQCREILLLASGWACREWMLPHGRRAVLDFYLPGDLIALDHLFLECAPDSVVTLTTAGYYSLGCEVLRTLCRQNSEVVLEIARLLSSEKQRLERHATRLARLPALERTVATLQHLCERMAARRGEHEERDSGTAFRLPLTQQLLADHLGLNLVHLNRTLRALRSGNVLKIESGGIAVEDLQRLRGAAANALDRI